MCGNRVKLEFFESSEKRFQVDHCSLEVISEVLFFVGCYICFAFEEKGMELIDWASEGSG
jgi:hypothetical protein